MSKSKGAANPITLPPRDARLAATDKADDSVTAPNYSMSNLLERARASRERFSNYIEERLALYESRNVYRSRNRVPVVAFLGMGRAGKDTAAEYFCHRAGITYAGSSSSMVLPIIADSIGISPERAWAERHQNRPFWIEWCHAFRHEDPALLVKMCLGVGDVVVGVRGKIELHDVQSKGVVGYSLWVDNPRVETDPTVEFSVADCDFSIPNYGGVTDLYRRIDVLVDMLSIPHFLSKGK